MSVFLMQTIVAARNRNIEDSGWVQILVFIAMAVFWILGAMKAKSRKKEESEEQESMPMHRPHASAPDSDRGVQQEKLSPQQRRAYVAWREQQSQKQPKQPKQQKRTIARPQPSVQKTAALKPLVAKKLGTMRGLDADDLFPEDVLELEAPKDSVGGRSPGKGRYVAQADEPTLLVGLRSDYADPEQLRRAIVHCEILGKPLSLRPPGEQMIG